MSWKVRAVIIGVAWIVVPWTWAIAAEQARRGSRAEDDAAAGAD